MPDDNQAPGLRERAGERAQRIVREQREREAQERRALADRLDELERRVAAQGGNLNVPEALQSLHERLELLEATPKKGKLREPFDWDDLEPDERAEVLAELTTWAETVLVARYRAKLGRREELPDGWQHQPHLRDLVTAAWLGWLYAYKNPAARLTEQWQWHRDVLGNIAVMLEDAGNAAREHLGAAGR